MTFKLTVAALAASLCLTGPLWAGDAHGPIVVEDSYARSSSPSAKSGAAFMMLKNTGTEADRLVAARTDAAKRTELHTHMEDANGVMKMMHVTEGFEVPAGGALMLERGGKHVMLMGLTGALEQGETVTLTLTFEQAGDVTVEVPVDLTRKAGGHEHSGHSGH